MSARPYILGSVVARGGMAEVFRGLVVGQDGFRRPVAIKKILPHHAQNAEFAEMFKDEAHIGQRLQHANIVKVEGFDIIEGSASIIMEFIDGIDLRSALSATEAKKDAKGIPGRIPLELCVYVVAEAARGLHYAHTRKDNVTGKPLNIVHRDISPQNLLISWEGEVKVTDFGIAAADRDLKATETRAGIVKGKYSYMSPEQITGKKVDPRTDVFALCVVLWEILAMRRLFTSDNEIEVIEMVRSCKIPLRLRDVNPMVSQELEAIVLTGLSKDPKKRYDSMESLEKTLRAYLNKQSTPVTGHELGGFLRGVMPERFEKSQEDMQKLLTALGSATAPQTSTNLRQVVELNLDEKDRVRDGITVSRAKFSVPSTNSSKLSSAAQPVKQPTSFGQPGKLTSSPLNRSIYTSRSVHQGSKNPALPAMQLAFFALIVIGGAFGVKTYRNTAKSAPIIGIQSTPANVRIKINERDHANGRYVTAPTKVRLDKGLNYVEVSRPGYKLEKILINTESDTPKSSFSVRLKPNAEFAPVKLQISGSPAPVTVSVNDGFFRIQLSDSRPAASIPDITNNVTSEVLVTDKDKRTLLRCSFTPEKTNDRRPMTIILDLRDRNCKTNLPPTSKGGA